MQRVPLTSQGASRLREELDRLKRVERPRITEAIAEARSHGDLKENAEYHAAREQQGLNEARIRDLEGQLSMAEIIDVAKLDVGPRVVFGATVTLLDEADDSEKQYQIVGDLEADMRENRVSVSSPLARALIGKEEGDQVEVDAPGGRQSFEIAEVEYK